MNKKLVFSVIGKLMIVLSVILLLPLAISVIYREKTFWAFLITSLFSLALGFLLKIVTKGYSNVLYAKEGFVIVALAWLSTSVIGSFPFFISGEIPSYIDAFFETVSGFTTTGASILTDVEALSKSSLFWRSLTHWIGGMGVLVFMIAFISNISDRSIHILRAEMPGPIIGKLTPRAKDTSKVLYIMYFVMTLIQILLLWAGDMSLFDSVVHSFATAGTGGFGIKGDSIASYSPYSQWVITVFMFLFGINFNLYYLILIKRFKAAIKSSELWVYFFIVVIASTIIAFNISKLYSSISTAIRDSFFQVVSISTTTGFATADFDLWPSLSKGILFALMMIGACAGSTAGGLKVSRIVILFKMIAKEIKHLIHPRSVSSINFEGKEVDNTTQNSVTTYFAIYMLSFFVIFLLLCLEPFSFETNISAVAACFNNIGPGFAGVGPMANYSEYSAFSKLILSYAMLLGRLEIFPLLIATIPSTWKKKS